MPLLNVLPAAEAKLFDTPPISSGEERKKYFRLTVTVQNMIDTFIAPHVKVGFMLHLGYFKATGRFFLPDSSTKMIWIL